MEQNNYNELSKDLKSIRRRIRKMSDYLLDENITFETKKEQLFMLNEHK